MIEWIQQQLKRWQANYQKWKEDQDRKQKLLEKKQKKIVPPTLQKLVELYPLLRFMDYYHPLLIDPDEESEFSRDLEVKEYIKQTQAELTETLYENARASRDGTNGRRIRPATPEELEKYTRKTTDQSEILKIQNDINIISAFGGIPEIKAFHLEHVLHAKMGSKVFLSSSNIVDPYFPELVSIGDNTIFGLGASVFCHEIIDGELYVGKVEIGKNCLVGVGSIVLPGTRMEEGSILTPGFLTSDLTRETMTQGLDSSIRLSKAQTEHLPKRRTEKLDFTLHDYMSKLIFPHDKPLKTPFVNMFLEWQKSPLISQAFRQKLLKQAGIKLGTNVKIEDNVHFDTFYPEKITIGNGVLIKNNATIATHEGTVNNFRTGKIEIGNNVIIESGVKILPGVKIGDNSVIYPYAFVVQDIPPNTNYQNK